MLNRRQFISASAAFTFLGCNTQRLERTWKVGICDWHAGGACVPEAFTNARELKLDGVQFSYVPDHKKYDLRQKEVQQFFLDLTKKNNLEMSSMAMGIYNHAPFSTHEKAVEWANECLDIMAALKQNIVLFAFFGKGDIKNQPDLQKKVIARLKEIAPKAEKLNLTIGLETWLNKEEHMAILDAVGSNAVKVYYDTANMQKMGYNLHEEIPWLGAKKAICQIHLKENGKRLGQGVIDFAKVKEDLIAIDYKNWLIIEASVTGDWKESQKANSQFVNKLFNNVNI